MIEVTVDDFAVEGTQYVIGMAPCQIDLLTSLTGMVFAECWKRRETSEEEDPIHYIGRDDLRQAKRLAGRLIDLADLEEMNRADPGLDGE